MTNKDKILAECKPLLEKLHSLQPTGNMETIRLLFSDMAKKPVPIHVLLSLIGIESELGLERPTNVEPSEQATKSSFPTISRDQLLRLFHQGVQEKDSVDELSGILKTHIEKLEAAGAKAEEPKPAEAGSGGAQV